MNIKTIAVVIIIAVAILWSISGSNAPVTSTTTNLPVILQSSTTPATPETVTVSIYFTKGSDSSASCPYAVFRTIPYTTAVGQASLAELFKGPTASEKEQGYKSCFIGTGVVAKSLKIENGTATVDLSKEYDLGCGGATSCSAQSRSAVTNTLKQFPTVKTVQIQIEGVLQISGSGEGA